MASKPQKKFPRVNLVKDNDTQQALVELWNALHDQTTSVTSATSSITAADSTITELQATIAQMQKQITALLAGGGTSQPSTVGGGGSGGTSGGSGGGTPGGGDPILPEPTDIPNQSGTVAQAKADLIAEGADLMGSCGGFAITNRAAGYLGGNYGILSKPGGNNCNGYAVDIICVKPADPGQNQMAHFNVLIDSEGAQIPTWGFVGYIDADLWRSPV